MLIELTVREVIVRERRIVYDEPTAEVAVAHYLLGCAGRELSRAESTRDREILSTGRPQGALNLSTEER